MPRGAPSANTPDPAPRRVEARFAAVVPLASPTAPSSSPPSLFPGPSKLAKLNTLNAETLGSMVNLSLILIGHAKVTSKVRSQARPTFPGGARATQLGWLDATGVVPPETQGPGVTAPKATNCDCVKNPALTNAWPAGVSCPAELL